MSATSNVVQLPTPPATSAAETEKQSEKKFGKAVMSHGLYIIPALVLRGQARLLLNSTQMVVLLQLLDFWWAADGSAYPKMKTIAERVSLSPKQVQRTINALVEKGLITRINRTNPDRGKTSNLYKFDGLIEKLKEIEKDFEKARKTKRDAGKPGGIVGNQT